MDQYYYSVDGKRSGPVPESDLTGLYTSGRVTSSTLVWTAGMDDWKPYGEVFQSRDVPPPLVPPPLIPPMEVKPDNGLAGSITATVLSALFMSACCSPFSLISLIFGVVAIIKSTNVDTLWNKGSCQAAKDSARSAKNWTIWSFIINILPLVLIVALFGAAAMHPSLFR